MTVKTAISLRRPLLDEIDVAANRKLLAQINETYADGPDAEERETQKRIWELQRRKLREEEW